MKNYEIKNIDGGETWEDIPGWDGLYQASTLGRVKSLGRVEVINHCKYGQILRVRKGKVLKQHISAQNNYLTVDFYNEDGRKHLYVHRLIAQTFIPNPLNLTDVNHKKGNKLDNRACMLEWCTKSYNMNHALSTGLSSAKGATHYKAKKVIDINTGKVYGTVKEAAKVIGISNSYMKNMLSGINVNITSIRFLKAI